MCGAIWKFFRKIYSICCLVLGSLWCLCSALDEPAFPRCIRRQIRSIFIQNLEITRRDRMQLWRVPTGGLTRASSVVLPTNLNLKWRWHTDSCRWRPPALHTWEVAVLRTNAAKGIQKPPGFAYIKHVWQKPTRHDRYIISHSVQAQFSSGTTYIIGQEL